MAWQGIEGHDEVVAKFRRILAADRLASTYLFVGPTGIGKKTFALRLAQALLCSVRPAAALDPCGQCASCLQVIAGTHPDLHLVARPPDKSFIPLELLIGPKEKRMQEGLCHDISLKPFMGGRRVAIIDDADYLNEEGANCLLKTLEEPPPRSVMILVGTSADRQLPTIRSRAQIVRFRPLGPEVVENLLVSRGVVTDRAEAGRLAAHSGGSMEQASAMADAALWRFRDQLCGELAQGDFDGVDFARRLIAFVEEAGKEAPLRRKRMRLVIGFAVDFYRAVLRAVAGGPCQTDQERNAAVDRAAASGRFDALLCAALVDRSLEALGHVDRNAHQAALLECWLDDLTRIARGASAAVA